MWYLQVIFVVTGTHQNCPSTNPGAIFDTWRNLKNLKGALVKKETYTEGLHWQFCGEKKVSPFSGWPFCF